MTINWNDIIYYDETSPSCIRWKYDRLAGRYRTIIKAKADSIAGSIKSDKKGYKSYTLKVSGKSYVISRIIWLLHFGQFDESLKIDHVDRDSLNNKIGNLRLVETKVNNRNRKVNARNTTGSTGIYIQKRNRIECSVVANCCDLNSIRFSKSFSIKKYGKDKATELAQKWREQMFSLFVNNIDGYTSNHGNASQAVIQSDLAKDVVSILELKVKEQLEELSNKPEKEKK